jgi:hypothetical protein
MKRIAVVFALLLCVFALAGCKKSAIQGEWRDDAGVVYNFTKDFAFTIDIGDDVVVGGTFAIEEGSDKVVFTFITPGGENIVSEATFAFSDDGDTLSFTGADGLASVLHK